MRDFPINIRLEKVINYLKFRENISVLDAKTETLVFKEIVQFSKFMQTLGIYKVQAKSESTNLFLNSKNVETLLQDSPQVLFFAVTIGKKIDEQIEFFLNENVLKASIWDAIASEAVEQAANYFNSHLAKKFLLQDLVATTRYSPGYGDWPLDANFGFYELLNLGHFGISINAAGLLIPQKTITAITGLKSRL